MRIENWSIVCSDYIDPYKAPEMYSSRICGEVYGNGNFDDGTVVTTSKIISVRGDIVITHSGSEYELGEVDAEYEKQFPNARERLFNSLTK
jgi:hypothetical protein